MATVAITADQDVVTGEIFIEAPPARVFQAITDPSQMPRWWGASDRYRVKEWKADLRVGGRWSSEGVNKDGSDFPRRRRISRGRSSPSACTYLDLQLDGPSQNRSPLGTRAAKRARPSFRTGPQRAGTTGQNSTRRLRWQSRRCRRPFQGLEACFGMAGRLRRERRNRRHAPLTQSDLLSIPAETRRAPTSRLFCEKWDPPEDTEPSNLSPLHPP